MELTLRYCGSLVEVYTAYTCVTAGKSPQGRVKIPTGGILSDSERESASAFLRKGQQIRCEAGTDGHSPDKRGVS